MATARAFANGPRLLRADEVTGALDSATGSQIVQLLLDLRAQRGVTILLVDFTACPGSVTAATPGKRRSSRRAAPSDRSP